MIWWNPPNWIELKALFLDILSVIQHQKNANILDYSTLSDMELDIGLSLLLSKIMIKESRLQ